MIKIHSLSGIQILAGSGPQWLSVFWASIFFFNFSSVSDLPVRLFAIELAC